MKKGLLGLLLLAGSLCAASNPADVAKSMSGTKKDLLKIQREIKQGDKKVQKLDREAEALKNRVLESNRRLEAARRSSMVHERNLSLVEFRLSRVQAKLASLEESSAAERLNLGASLARLYRARSSGGTRVLLGASKPSEFEARARYLSALSKTIYRRAKELSKSIAELEEVRRETSHRETDLQHQRVEAEQARRLAAAEARQKELQLKKVRSNLALARAFVQSRTEAEDNLQSKMDGLQREADRLAEAKAKEEARVRQAANSGGVHYVRLAGPSSFRGRLPWPLRGRLLTHFGKQRHPIFKTPVFNRGIEIAARAGTPILAVAKGVVVLASEMEGFGRIVVVDHGGGMMSVYGYASQLKVALGQKVLAGTELAEVGENSTSGQPSLYFEIRRGAKALDPQAYLGRR